MLEKPLYCQHCGHKKVSREVISHSFDENTGEKVRGVVYECVNKVCVLGCRNTGGHYFPCGFFGGIKYEFSGIIRCSSCGEIECKPPIG